MTENNLTFHLGKVFKVDLVASLHSMYRHHGYILSICMRHVCTHLQTQAFKNVLHLYTTRRELIWFTRWPISVLPKKGSWHVQESCRGRFSNMPYLSKHFLEDERLREKGRVLASPDATATTLRQSGRRWAGEGTKSLNPSPLPFLACTSEQAH